MKSSYYQSPKPSWMMRQLWKCAGGDRYILERATYADQMKYMCLGGVVLATGLMAALAGGYAFYTIFVPKGDDALEHYKQIVNATGKLVSVEQVDIPTAVRASIFGLVWGLIIFNIDRFIVTSTGKGDGTEAITWDELKGAVPRIIMGAIIALTISKPIEIRMFKSEIDGELTNVQDSVIRHYKANAEQSYLADVKQADLSLGKLYEELSVKRARLYFLDSMISLETQTNCEGRCQEYKDQKVIVEREIQSIVGSPEYVRSDSAKIRFQSKLDEENTKAEAKGRSIDGLLLRIQLAHKVAGFWISLFITLLFMAIELTPIFFKLMLVKTPYDFLEDNIKDLVKAENGIEVRYDYYKDKKGQERHLVINHEAERKTYEMAAATNAQKELTDYALEKFKDGQRKKIDENPEAFVSTEPQV